MKKAKEKPTLADEFPERMSVTFTVHGELDGKPHDETVTLDVVEMSIATLGRVSQILRPVRKEIAEAPDLLSILDECGDEMVAALAVAVNRPVAEVMTWPSKAFLDVLLAVLEVNADFFVHRLPPVAYALSTMKNSLNGGGPTPLHSFGATAAESTLTPSH